MAIVRLGERSVEAVDQIDREARSGRSGAGARLRCQVGVRKARNGRAAFSGSTGINRGEITNASSKIGFSPAIGG